jgi:hypothetical protein
VEEQTAPVKEVIATLMTNEINRAIAVSMRKYLHAELIAETVGFTFRVRTKAE